MWALLCNPASYDNRLESVGNDFTKKIVMQQIYDCPSEFDVEKMTFKNTSLYH